MNRIRELREEKRITQVRLSIELGVAQETISAYEVGKHYPSVKSMIKLREIFGVTIDYILGLTDSRYSAMHLTDLKNDEVILIEAYRRMDRYGREKTKAYVEGYLDAMEKHKNQ